MKQILLLSALALGLVVSAQGKIDLTGRLMLDSYKTALSAESRAGAKPVVEISQLPQEVTVIATLDDPSAIAGLEACGATLRCMVGDGIAIVNVPLDRMESISRLPSVNRLSFGRMARPLLDKAREAGNVDAVQTAEATGTAWSGKGVVLGLMDTGLDPNHIDFANADGTASRVSRVWEFTGSDGSMTSYATPAEISRFTTENDDETHGTHVTGIMGGSYKGGGEFAVVNTLSGMVTIRSGEKYSMPYYGVAPQSDLALSCGPLTDANIIMAARQTLDYAKETGRPAVFNLSIGDNMGPHDGTDPMSQALAEMGKEMVICIAAGNDGMNPISLQPSFGSETAPVKTFLTSSDEVDKYDSYINIWSKDATPIAVSFVIYDLGTQSILYTYRCGQPSDWVSITSDEYNAEGYIHDYSFNKAFKGYVRVAADIDETNNRYEVLFDVNLTNRASNNSILVPALVFEGPEGSSCDVYSYGSLDFSSRGMAGWTEGNSHGSINGMACGENVIVAGSFNSRRKWGALNKGLYSIPSELYDAGLVSPFTSYGKLLDGRILPDLCAPGSMIVSAYSQYFIENTGFETEGATAFTDANGRKNYWATMMGTSMATPFVAGTAALLLEADPTLDVNRIRDLLCSTAVKGPAPQASMGSEMQWGAGKIDALAAMRKLLGQSSVINALGGDENKRLVMSVESGLIDVFVADAASMRVSLYDMAGSLAATGSCESQRLTLSTASVSPGVYVLEIVPDKGARISRRVLIR